MKAHQLTELRKSRGLTRAGLAVELNCSAAAIVHWERGTREIPAWVEEKMLRSIPVALPLADLSNLLDLARDRQQDFQTMLAHAIREYLARHAAPALYDLPMVADADAQIPPVEPGQSSLS